MPIAKNKTPKPKNSLISLVVLAVLISFFVMFNGADYAKTEEVSFSQFKEDVTENRIKDGEVVLSDNKLSYELEKTGNKQYTFKEASANMTELLSKEQLESIDIRVNPNGGFWTDLLVAAVPAVLILFFFLFMFRQAQSSNSQAMSFGKSKAKLYDGTQEKTSFKDVAGAVEAKAELEEVVDFLKNPAKYAKMGAKIPKGVLLVGPPGTGKTLLARAVAGEAEVPFFNISGSEFVEMFVGVGASRVRDLFKKAKRNAPCIVFIDEIDAVGRQRGAGMGGGNDEREQTLNQILTEMDGFEQGTSVIVISATNRPDVLDPALLRPGRFDRRVTVDAPDLVDREEILKVHIRNKPMAKGVSLSKIARQTPGFTGADLESLLNEAAITAARNNKKVVTQADMEHAVEKVALGPERRSKVLSKSERKITAYHEVGHALVGHMLSECDPVHKISIISRGSALGVTWYLPEDDKHLYSKQKFEHEIRALLAGYVSEEIFFGQVTTGASNDLQRASNMARRMVTEYGMSDLGPIVYGEKQGQPFLGKEYGHVKNYSEEMASKIDQKVAEFIEEGYKETKKIVESNKDLMDEIAQDLLKKETINRKKFLSYFETK